MIVTDRGAEVIAANMFMAIANSGAIQLARAACAKNGIAPVSGVSCVMMANSEIEII